MAKVWTVNSSTQPRWIGDKLCHPGEGNFVEEGPLQQPPQLGNPADALTAAQVAALSGGQLLTSAGALAAYGESTPVVTLTATGQAYTGECEYGGYYCRVAAGNITVYDNTSATGTPIVPTQALAVGPMPWMGAGTNGRRVCTTGLHVVLSGAATVDVLVAGV